MTSTESQNTLSGIIKIVLAVRIVTVHFHLTQHNVKPNGEIESC